MLIDLNTGKPITKLPYAADFRTVMRRLPTAQIQDPSTDHCVVPFRPVLHGLARH